VTEYLEFFAAAYNIHGAARKKVVGDVLELTDLKDKAAAEVNSLSRGMRQRLSVARVLLHDPKVLLMDEPASGLDPRARIEMRELLKELRRMGKTILISSHILPELAELCNVVGIIERGQLLFAGSVDEILRRAKMGHVLHVGVSDRHEAAVQLLGKLPGIKKVALANDDAPTRANGATKVIHVSYEDAAGLSVSDIPNVLINAGFRLTKFTEEPVNLETAFMRLTKGLVQ
jgi:ABC-2 type transport system ATP-binding protein